MATSSRHLVILAASTLGLVACSQGPFGGKPTPDAPVDGAPDAAVGSADPLAALAALPPMCSDAGWCWNEPTPGPGGLAYQKIVASDPNNVWLTAGGPPYAVVLQWDGTSWTRRYPTVPTGYPTSQGILGLSTNGPNDAWIVYGDLVDHWDGSAWTIIVNDDGSVIPMNVWEDPIGDAWVTDTGGNVTVYQSDGQVVMAFPLGASIGSIWGTATDDVFVTTIGGLFHYDGTMFSLVYQGGKTAGTYAGTRTDVWVSGGGAILHWNGIAVTDMTPAVLPPTGWPLGVDYEGSSDVTWISNGDIGAPSYVLQWDGTQITSTNIGQLSTPLEDSFCAALGGAARLAGRWWIVCQDGDVAEMPELGVLQPVISPWTGAGNFWGTSMSDLYFGTGWGLRHFDGSAWTDLHQPIESLVGLAGTGTGSADELFGSHFIYSSGTYSNYFDHFDGSAWTSLLVTQYMAGSAATNLRYVYALGPGEAMIVGGVGTALHYQDGALTPVTSGTTNDLNGIWGPDADHLSISGTNGTLLQWVRTNPGVFTPDPSFPANTDELHTIAFAGTTTWIIPANENYVYRKANGTWTTVATPVVPTAIAALSDDDVVIDATDSGYVARWDGSAFDREVYPSWTALQGLYALPDGTMLASGLQGFVMHPPPATASSAHRQ